MIPVMTQVLVIFHNDQMTAGMRLLKARMTEGMTMPNDTRTCYVRDSSQFGFE